MKKVETDGVRAGDRYQIDLALGRERIDACLEPVAWLLEQGGYVPFGDHSIPPEVSWDNFTPTL